MIAHCQKPGCGKSWPRDPVLEVACPDCRAPIGSPCKRPSGHRAMEPHARRDLLADECGHYGDCPLGCCGLAYEVKAAAKLAPGEARFKTEPTRAGLQYVIPGCEKKQPGKDEQGSLW